MFGSPVDLLVEFEHAIAQLGGLDEPRRHCLVDQRVLAAVAVRVWVVVRRLAKQAPVCLEALGDWLVGVEDVLALEVGDQRIELTALVNRNVSWNVCGVAEILVVFTVGRSLVHDAGALIVGNIVANQNLPGV